MTSNRSNTRIVECYIEPPPREIPQRLCAILDCKHSDKVMDVVNKYGMEEFLERIRQTVFVVAVFDDKPPKVFTIRVLNRHIEELWDKNMARLFRFIKKKAEEKQIYLINRYSPIDTTG